MLINQIPSTLADQICGTEYGTTSDLRANVRGVLLKQRDAQDKNERFISEVYFDVEE